MSPRISAMDSDDSEDEGFQQPVCYFLPIKYCGWKWIVFLHFIAFVGSWNLHKQYIKYKYEFF